jgi:hypothetical protein
VIIDSLTIGTLIRDVADLGSRAVHRPFPATLRNFAGGAGFDGWIRLNKVSPARTTLSPINLLEEA